ncbi:hypothetical protein LOAG_05175 [Loa loa]|uniref:Uncharacterized protein n=1 Tax=Loa loa TaxID=7209 RepID=A0A1S0U0K2_LOALO|nr:hypothetical protein LOAG_05175 [Loa loa]EFO23313.1 hypothetical protein LOAG_05175 [Loa loa]
MRVQLFELEGTVLKGSRLDQREVWDLKGWAEFGVGGQKRSNEHRSSNEKRKVQCDESSEENQLGFLKRKLQTNYQNRSQQINNFLFQLLNFYEQKNNNNNSFFIHNQLKEKKLSEANVVLSSCIDFLSGSALN